MRIFHSPTPNGDINARINACYDNIKAKITDKCGVSEFIEKDGLIAFSGNSENPESVLTVSVMKSGSMLCLYADLDDEMSWQEWDYESQDEFENKIAEYISPLINRTIKTVTEKKRHKYIKISRYYSDKNDRWILIDEDIIDYLPIRLFITKDSVKEDLKSYQIL